MSIPTFDHHCQHCIFLGKLNGYDLYHDGDSYLLRYGNEPPKYWSSADFRGRKSEAARGEVAGSGCAEVYYRRLVGIRLFSAILAGDMRD